MKESKLSKSHNERAHSTVGASGSERWLNCPGSVQAEANSPEQAENEWSKAGTDNHEKLEKYLRSWLKTKKFPKLHSDDEHLSVVIEYVIKRYEEMGLSDSDVLLEQKVDLSEIVDPDCFGTNDIGLVELFGTLEIIDYKSGGKIVSPVENTQLIYYALGIAYLFDFNFTEVKLTIAQPPNTDNPIESWTIPIEKLESYIELFKKGVQRTKKKDAKRYAGKWCHYCRAAATCETLKDKTMAKVIDDFDFEEPKELVVVEKKLTPELVAKYLDAADTIETWVSAIRARASEMLQNGVKVPGWQMVPTNPRRYWKSEKGAAKIAEKSKLKFYKETPMSPAEVQKKVGNKIYQERFEVFVDLKSSGNERLTRVRDVTTDFDEVELTTTEEW